jgi:hypothetical protein
MRQWIIPLIPLKASISYSYMYMHMWDKFQISNYSAQFMKNESILKCAKVIKHRSGVVECLTPYVLSHNRHGRDINLYVCIVMKGLNKWWKKEESWCWRLMSSHLELQHVLWNNNSNFRDNKKTLYNFLKWPCVNIVWQCIYGRDFSIDTHI